MDRIWNEVCSACCWAPAQLTATLLHVRFIKAQVEMVGLECATIHPRILLILCRGLVHSTVSHPKKKCDWTEPSCPLQEKLMPVVKWEAVEWNTLLGSFNQPTEVICMGYCYSSRQQGRGYIQHTKPVGIHSICCCHFPVKNSWGEILEGCNIHSLLHFTRIWKWASILLNTYQQAEREVGHPLSNRIKVSKAQETGLLCFHSWARKLQPADSFGWSLSSCKSHVIIRILPGL